MYAVHFLKSYTLCKNTIGQLVNWYIYGKVYRLCSDAFNMYRFNRNCSV